MASIIMTGIVSSYMLINTCSGGLILELVFHCLKHWFHLTAKHFAMGTSATPLINTSGFRMPEQPTVTVTVYPQFRLHLIGYCLVASE